MRLDEVWVVAWLGLRLNGNEAHTKLVVIAVVEVVEQRVPNAQAQLAEHSRGCVQRLDALLPLLILATLNVLIGLKALSLLIREQLRSLVK